MITIDARWIDASGIGTYLENIIPGIIEKSSDQTVTLLGSADKLEAKFGKLISRCQVIEAHSKMYSIREQLDYIKLIPKETELYFATHYNIPLFYSGKMLVMVYDVMHLAMPHFAPGWHKQLYARIMFNALRKKANSIVTISEFTKTEMKRLIGNFEQSIYPIHLGVGKEWFSIPVTDSPHSKPYILYVGNIKPHKNLKTLVKSYIEISSSIPHDLILVGKKDGFITGDNDITKLSKDLEKRIHFTGRVSDESLRQYFKNADVFVFPSHYEGFGLPPLEAMAAGCPVLSSNAASLPEICGKAAIYFDPHDVTDLANKLKSVTTNKNLKLSLKELGLDRAKDFSWNSCVDKTYNIIQTLLEETSPKQL